MDQHETETKPSRHSLASGLKRPAVYGAGLLLVGAAAYGVGLPPESGSASAAADSAQAPEEVPDGVLEPDDWTNIPAEVERYAKGAHGLHGEVPYPGGDDGADALAWQQGKVTSESGGEWTVRSPDGTAWTWTRSDETAVHPGSTEADTVRKGDEVWVLGAREGKERAAQHLVDLGERGRSPVLEVPDNCKKDEGKGGLTVTCEPGDRPDRNGSGADTGLGTAA